jgi:hypothetical protein
MAEESLPAIGEMYFDTRSCARYLGVSTALLELWRMKGEGPRFFKLSAGRRGAVRYRRSDVDRWVEARLAGGEKVRS